jgi:hypothetical protein
MKTYTMAVGWNDTSYVMDLDTLADKELPLKDTEGQEIGTAKIVNAYIPEGCPLHVSFETDAELTYRVVLQLAKDLGFGEYI